MMDIVNKPKYHKQVFIINGSGGVGKDLFVNMVKTSVSKFSPYRVWNYSSIDKVKAIATQIGWSGGKTEKDRKFLSDLKLLTTEYNDMAFEDLKRMVNIFEEQKDVVFLFLHIREPSEIERAKNEFNAHTILITRDSVPQITSNMADGGVFNYHYDTIIKNNDTKEMLQGMADLFAQDWLFEENE
jgi:hypothetical protein